MLHVLEVHISKFDGISAQKSRTLIGEDPQSLKQAIELMESYKFIDVHVIPEFASHLVTVREIIL